MQVMGLSMLACLAALRTVSGMEGAGAVDIVMATGRGSGVPEATQGTS